MSIRKIIGALTAAALACGTVRAVHDPARRFEARAAESGGRITSETDNPFDEQNDKEVPYDKTRWIQPAEWNCPVINPREYPGGIMLYFDKIGLEPEYGRGKVQRVYFSIVGASEPVSHIKFHFYYDTRLKVKENDNGEVLTVGKAFDGFTTGSAMVEEGQLAFYAYAAEDTALPDGSIFTVDFIIPKDAEPGDLYPFGLAYTDDGIAYDIFLNSAKDDAGKLQMTYVFTRGIYNGYIKIMGEKPPAEPLKGDYNDDKALTVADAVLLARFIAEDSALTNANISAVLNHEPDYDSDGLVTFSDVTQLLLCLDTE